MRMHSAIPRIAHDLGLATWFGGSYMGAVSLNGASREVDDPRQRARVANAGWLRWAAVVPVAVGAHLIGLLGLARHASGPVPLRTLRTVVTGAALLATLESGRSGRQVASFGDVPVATAVQPVAGTPRPVVAAQRRLRFVQWAIPALTASLFVLDAYQRPTSEES